MSDEGGGWLSYTNTRLARSLNEGVAFALIGAIRQPVTAKRVVSGIVPEMRQRFSVLKFTGSAAKFADEPVAPDLPRPFRVPLYPYLPVATENSI